MSIFEDRVEAGRRLGERLGYLRGQDIVVLGLPRGGVPVASEVAIALDAPLDVIVVRKLGVPFQPELAMGAIGEGGARVLDKNIISHVRVTETELAAVEERERAVLESRLSRFRKGRTRADLGGRTAVIVDDGIATGSTARVACRVARELGAAKVVLAVPVAPADTLADLTEPDEVICLATPRRFNAVGSHYRDFSPTDDDEVVVLLDAAASRWHGSRKAANGQRIDEDIRIDAGAVQLEGHLYVPAPGAAVVVFAHGSGSSRHSPRNRFVASFLQRAGLGTLLVDLLTPAEELHRANVFDIGLLASRLSAAARSLASREDTAESRVGYFGASTGAGAALWAAAETGARVEAVVSRGGRPDLAGDRLSAVRAPTRLIVGGADSEVLELNRWAQARMQCPNELSVVPGATHLFEEPGALSEAAALAREWFVRYLPR
ncbi:phosphoribosyltransferase family protein [Arthrobacter sp. ISL-72]|uniref:phosphoribosyltransferase family protein n=1 Tax=Arthrobacter sp. ISL-72 TaxID=2819114 RepID=UPI001BE85021|nr:phosphoribosyltransferase family protein [Arthrobacter sp. ISL-72]MBT2596697.1 dienelactone hydrolase family protein [Arthrobacter sp. ISL-72]